MRITTTSFAAAMSLTVAAAFPAAAQSIPLWRFASSQQFNVPKCAAPARLTEMRTAQGRVFWRCVSPTAR